jgi:hypothetical protein
MTRFASFVLILGIGCLLPQMARAIDQKTVNERTKQIQMMSKVDRDRLDRNIVTFESLSSSDKARLEALHAELQNDRATAGGLTALLQTYSAWLQTLSPVQQEEIRKEPDPARRLAIVRRMKEESDHSKTVHEAPVEEAAPPPPSSKFPFRGALDSKDLAAVIKVITDRLPQERLKPDFDRPQLDAYLQTIQASARLSNSYKEWPDDALLQKMIASIKSKEVSGLIYKSSSKRDAMIRALLMGIMRQLHDSIKFPSDDELLQIYDSLSTTERQQLMTHPQRMVNQMLRKRYFDSKNDDSYKKLPYYHRQVDELFEKFDVQPPPSFLSPKPPRPPGRG